jgi:hypothetical protein
VKGIAGAGLSPNERDLDMNSFRWVVLLISGCGAASSPSDAGVPLFSGLGGGAGGGAGGGSSGGGQGGGVVAPPPLTTCQETLDCMFACPGGDTTCQNACYANGSEEGNALLLSLAECVEV